MHRIYGVQDNPSTDNYGPIDIVYTWVDGQNNRHQDLIKKFGGAASYNRYANNQEIFMSLTTIETYAPWVRTIYIVIADYQTFDTSTLSPWLKEKIRIISHRHIIPEEFLPVFSSQVIESFLYKITSLSSSFIYFNDDMFLGRTVYPHDFFDKSGTPYMLIENSLSYYRIPLMGESGLNTRHWGFFHAISLFIMHTKSNCLFKCFYYKKPLHQCYPASKNTMARLWQLPHIGGFLNKQSLSRFRSIDTVNFFYLMYLVGLSESTIKLKLEPSSAIFGIKNKTSIDKGITKLKLINPKMFCVNNELKKSDEKLELAYRTKLQTYIHKK